MFWKLKLSLFCDKYLEKHAFTEKVWQSVGFCLYKWIPRYQKHIFWLWDEHYNINSDEDIADLVFIFWPTQLAAILNLVVFQTFSEKIEQKTFGFSLWMYQSVYIDKNIYWTPFYCLPVLCEKV